MKNIQVLVTKIFKVQSNLSSAIMKQFVTKILEIFLILLFVL